MQRSLLHRIAVEAIVERQQAHSLMVRHIGVNNDAPFTLALGGARKIDGFIKSHRPYQPEFL